MARATIAAPSTNAVMRAEDPSFLRLWHGFLTGRILVALALLMLQGLGQALSQNIRPLELSVSLAYLAATVLLRWLGKDAAPAPSAGPQWLASIGVDVLAVCALQVLHTGGLNFTPLFGIPILMAAVLGSLTLALGTTAAVTLLLLAWAWWLGVQSGLDATPHYLQSALTGTGYFILSFLVHLLATRLVREQQLAQRSQQAALLQAQVSALVMQNLSDGVLVVDAQHTVRVANPAGRQLLASIANTVQPFTLAQVAAWQPLLKLAQHTFEHSAPQASDVSLLSPGHSPIGLHVRTWLTAPSPGDDEQPGEGSTGPGCGHDERSLGSGHLLWVDADGIDGDTCSTGSVLHSAWCTGTLPELPDRCGKWDEPVCVHHREWIKPGAGGCSQA